MITEEETEDPETMRETMIEETKITEKAAVKITKRDPMEDIPRREAIGSQ